LIFFDNQLTKFRVFIVDPKSLSPLLSVALRSPIGWTPLTDITDKRTDKRTFAYSYS